MTRGALIVAVLYLTSCRCNTTDEGDGAKVTPSPAPLQSAEGLSDSGSEKQSLAPVPPKPPTAPKRAQKPSGGNEARNQPAVALYVADRLRLINKVVTLRVHAQAGDYFNCYYKGRETAYRHVRLRGDSSAYLDGYLPRDPAGEKLWLRLQKSNAVKLTVKVIMRPETVSDNCVGQVDVIDHSLGWNFNLGHIGPVGSAKNRLRNVRDKALPNNDPSIKAYVSARSNFKGRVTKFKVRARLGRQFSCKYRDAERTHYPFFLQGEGFAGLTAFLPRDKEGMKLARMLARDEGARLTVEVYSPKGRFDQLCPNHVEIKSWRVGWHR